MWCGSLVVLCLVAMATGQGCFCPVQNEVNLNELNLVPIGTIVEVAPGIQNGGQAFLLGASGVGISLQTVPPLEPLVLTFASVSVIKFVSLDFKVYAGNTLIYSDTCNAQFGEDTQTPTQCDFNFPCQEDVTRIEFVVFRDFGESILDALVMTACFEPEWCPWTNCGNTCGDPGTRSRVCDCPNPDPNRFICEGDVDVMDCPALPCCQLPPILSQWGEFDECTESCGAGTRTRVRTCTPNLDCPDCEGNSCDCGVDLTDTEDCFEPFDPPVVTDWDEWGDCGATCGTGTRTRERECVPDGDCPNCDVDDCDCGEELTDTGFCIVPPNPPSWGLWGPWRQCSVTCGEGTKFRRRKCFPDPDCPDCVRPRDCDCGDGEHREYMDCVVEPDDPYVGEWSEWSDCDAKCGLGSSSRSRECMIPECTSSQTCTDPLTEERECLIPIETIDYTNYVQFGSISIQELYSGDPAKVLAGSGVDPFAEAFLLDRGGEKDVITVTFARPLTVQFVSIQTYYASKVYIDYGPGGQQDMNTIGTTHALLDVLTVSEFDMCIEGVRDLTIYFEMPTSEITANELFITVCIPDEVTYP